MIDIDIDDYSNYLSQVGFSDSKKYITYLNQAKRVLVKFPEYSILTDSEKIIKFANTDSLFRKRFEKRMKLNKSAFDNIKSGAKRYAYYLQYVKLQKVLKAYRYDKSSFITNGAIIYFKIFDEDVLYPTKAICQKIQKELDLVDDFTTYQAKRKLNKIFNFKNRNNIVFLDISDLERKPTPRTKKRDNEAISSQKIGNLDFKIKTLLLKGVPGTGKSRAIENIINDKLQLKDHKQNILRINIHSASSNADLMQGIGISSTDGKIEYKEKQGLILNFIEKATFQPNQPFVLVLEEIQENSLNELIGDLIYLIEDDKRAKGYEADDEAYGYQELVEKIIADNPETAYVEVPYLVNSSTKYRKMIMPDNLYIFCTSNYRDDKKVIEDNLLRRFEVLEIYPKASVVHEYCRDFFEQLNENILTKLEDEIHPDRFLIGHSNWLKVDNEQDFYRAFLKVVVEFKDIKEVEFNDFKEIVQELPLTQELNFNSYKSLIEELQTKAGYDFLD